MSYKFYSAKNADEKNIELWDGKTLNEEIINCPNLCIAKLFKKFLNRSNLKILDAGCGLGAWTYFFKEIGQDVVGIEYQEEIVQRAKENDPSMPIYQGDINYIDYSNNHFSAYISLGVLEHFEDGPQKALIEAHRVLKSEGLIFISVPYLNLFRRLLVHPLREIYFFLYQLRGKKVYFWEYRYTKKELKRFLADTRFELIHTDIDDFRKEVPDYHMGLSTDFFFLRKKRGSTYELNFLGKILLRIVRLVSPWFCCSRVIMIAKKI